MRYGIDSQFRYDYYHFKGVPVVLDTNYLAIHHTSTYQQVTKALRDGVVLGLEGQAACIMWQLCELEPDLMFMASGASYNYHSLRLFTSSRRMEANRESAWEITQASRALMSVAGYSIHIHNPARPESSASMGASHLFMYTPPWKSVLLDKGAPGRKLVGDITDYTTSGEVNKKKGALRNALGGIIQPIMAENCCWKAAADRLLADFKERRPIDMTAHYEPHY